MERLIFCVFAIGCGSHGSTLDPPEDPLDPMDPAREHDPRFHGWWIVEQPLHALYEATYYNFVPTGALEIGPSNPADCTGHLAEHCVTGSVASGGVSCVFGAGWYSLDTNHLGISGVCSDGMPRDIVVEMKHDQSTNTEFGGAGGTLLAVGGESGWVHDNFDWAFRKCPPGTTPTTCR